VTFEARSLIDLYALRSACGTRATGECYDGERRIVVEKARLIACSPLALSGQVCQI